MSPSGDETTTSDKTRSKQRKLRKGTRSCWECKRRKARCVFLGRDDAICAGCRRRGTNCVNQNESEYEPETRDGATNRRLQRIETMLETLVARQRANGTTPVEEAPLEKRPAIDLNLSRRQR